MTFYMRHYNVLESVFQWKILFCQYKFSHLYRSQSNKCMPKLISSYLIIYVLLVEIKKYHVKVAHITSLAPQGIEPWYEGLEPSVLPLRRRGNKFKTHIIAVFDYNSNAFLYCCVRLSHFL